MLNTVYQHPPLKKPHNNNKQNQQHNTYGILTVTIQYGYNLPVEIVLEILGLDCSLLSTVWTEI